MRKKNSEEAARKKRASEGARRTDLSLFAFTALSLFLRSVSLRLKE